MKVRFKNPPIDEVVIGAYFDPPLTALRSEHIGLLWSRLREEFPTVEQRPPISSAVQGQEAILTFDTEFMTMPRYWFVSEDEVTLIQVQKDAFLLNWRRRNSEYPHYAENLKPGFDNYYRILEAFLKDDVGVEHPGIGRCELTYIDMIKPSEYWQGPQDTSGVIRSFSVPDCAFAHDAVPVFSCAYRYNVEPNLQLYVTIRSAESVNQRGSPLLYLEFKALGSPSGPAKSDADTWYDRAHEVIVAQFLNMTNKRVQRKLWILEETE